MPIGRRSIIASCCVAAMREVTAPTSSCAGLAGRRPGGPGSRRGVSEFALLAQGRGTRIGNQRVRRSSIRNPTRASAARPQDEDQDHDLAERSSHPPWCSDSCRRLLRGPPASLDAGLFIGLAARGAGGVRLAIGQPFGITQRPVPREVISSTSTRLRSPTSNGIRRIGAGAGRDARSCARPSPSRASASSMFLCLRHQTRTELRQTIFGRISTRAG